MGQQIGGIAGAVVGGVIGAFAGNPLMGAALGASIGGMIGGIIAPPDATLPNAQGPMEVTVNTFHRNLPVPVVYGICRVGGNIIWMGNIRTEVRKSGGGDKGQPETRRNYYHADWALALSEGPIQEIGRIWFNEQQTTHLEEVQGKTIFHTAALRAKHGIPATTAGAVALTIEGSELFISVKAYKGDGAQVADPLVAAAVPTNPPAFRHTGYLVLSGQLGQLPQIPQVAVELAGILAQLTPGTLPFGVRFRRWMFTDAWDLNVRGTLSGLFYPGWIFWINDVTTGPNFNAVHVAKDVRIDLTQDFTVKFFLHAEVHVLQTAVVRTGFAIVSDSSPDVNLFNATIYSTGFVEGGGGYQSGIDCRLSGCVGAPTGFFTLEFVQPAPPIGTGKVNQAWVTIAKRGSTVTVYCAKPGLAWVKVVEGTMGAATVGKFAVWSEGLVVAPPPTPKPLAWLSALTLIYHSMTPINYLQNGNPALIVYDFLTNTRYGVGLPASVLDMASFAEAAAFCDEDLSLGGSPVVAEGEEAPAAPNTSAPPEPSEEVADPRFRLDIALTDKKPALDHLNDMLATFRGFLVYQNGLISLRIEQVEAPVQSFSDTPTVAKEGIVEGSFGFAEISGRDRPNRVRIEYVRDDDAYRRDFVTVSDEYDQEVRGEIIEKTYTLLGIKRQKQANRMAQYFADFSALVRYVCSFRVGIGAMRAAVGDVITVTHSLPGWTQKLFRILAIKEQENDELELSCMEYVPYIYHDKEMPASIDGTKIIGSDAFKDPPNVLRFRVFEPRDNPLPVLYVTWTLDPAYGFYLDTFVFRKRGSGLFEGQGTHVVNASTAWLDHARIGHAGNPVSNLSLPAGRIRISGAITGMSAKVFDAGNNLLAQATEAGGSITLDVSAQANPFTGSIQLYADGAYTYPALRGRFPATGTFSLAHQTELTYQEEEITYSQNPAALRLGNLLGALPATGDLQVEDAEASYTAFTEGPDGDVVSGVTWPLEPAAVTLDNRIADLKVYQKESSVMQDRTAALLSPTSNVTLVPANGDALYIGSATKRLTLLWILLQRFASVSVQPAFSYAISNAGGSASYATVPTYSDGTAGFTQSGLIGIEPPANWVRTAKDTEGNTIGDGVERYYLRIGRAAVTVATPPIERRIFAAGELLLTLQEADNRMHYPYTPEDVGLPLTFEALARNVMDLTADQAKVPTDTLTVQQHALKPSPVSNLQVDLQAADLHFIGGDLVLNWLGTSKTTGAGRVEAGNDPDGAGGGQMDATFQNYVVRIYKADGVTLVRSVRVPDQNGVGTYTYPEEQRYADGVGNALLVKVYQQANNLLSDPAVLSLISSTLADVPSIANLPGFGHRYVPAMSEVQSVLALPGIAGVEAAQG